MLGVRSWLDAGVFSACAIRLALCAPAAAIVLSTQAAAQQPNTAAKPSAPAQRQVPTFQPNTLRSEEMQSIWAKLCGETNDPSDANKKVKVCTTQFEVLNKEAVPVLGGAITSVEGQPNELFSVTVPQGPKGIAIRPGVRVKIDSGEPIPLQYSFCFVHGCMAETAATKELIDGFKTGKTVVIGLFDTAGHVLSLPVPLQGFSVAYTGPSVDPKKYVELRQKVIDEYRKQNGAQPKPAAASAASAPGKSEKK